MTKRPSDAVGALEYDPNADSYRLAYDAGTTPPSLAVVSALESLADGERDGGAPLYDALDPDALDRLLSPSESAATRRSVTFFHLGYRITVSDRGYVEVRPCRDGDREGESG